MDKKSDLNHLEKICKEATPGPWKFWPDNEHPYDVRVCQEGKRHWCICCLALMGNTKRGIWTETTLKRWSNDANFIAISRTALPQLISEIRSLQSRLEVAEKALERILKGDTISKQSWFTT